MELFATRLPAGSRVLDIGAGGPTELHQLQRAGFEVFVCDYALDGGRFEYSDRKPDSYDGIYCAHTLEHTRNPGLFLDKIFYSLRPGGWLAIVVPPLKHEIVGGHLTLWNAGLLLYHLVRAGFDCSRAAVRTYEYNVAVVVQKVAANLRDLPLLEDNGDIELLAPFFPIPVSQGFGGIITEVGWR